MTRAIDSSVLAEIEKDSVRMCQLINLGLATPVYLTDAAFDIDYGGNTYQSSKYLIGAGDISETSEVRVGSIAIDLSSVGQTFTSAFLTYPYIGKQVVIYRAFLNATGGLVGTPVVIYDGRIDGFDLSEGTDNSTLTVSVSSHWSDFEKKSGRYTNSNSQELFFTGDKGFEFAANSVKDIKWGRA